MDGFKSEDDDTFQSYFKMNTVNLAPGVLAPCKCQCRQNHLCALEYLDIDMHKKCINEHDCSAKSLPKKPVAECTDDDGKKCGGSHLLVNMVTVILLMILAIEQGRW